MTTSCPTTSSESTTSPSTDVSPPAGCTTHQSSSLSSDTPSSGTSEPASPVLTNTRTIATSAANSSGGTTSQPTGNFSNVTSSLGSTASSAPRSSVSLTRPTPATETTLTSATSSHNVSSTITSATNLPSPVFVRPSSDSVYGTTEASSSSTYSTSTNTSTIQSSTFGRANGGGSRANTRSPNGAVAGGVIGGLVLLLIAACAIILLRRRARARRTAPSAEFIDIMRNGGLETRFGAESSGGALSPIKHDHGSTTPGLDYYSDAVGSTGGLDSTSERLTSPLARQSSLESNEPPPAFSPGSYKDPVLEKVHTAAEMREYYLRRESLASMAGAEPLGLDGHESEGGHGHEHTMDSEKATYAWAM
ncbi:hypothetical protein ONZ51_g13581 [Trametes cubensis]|uniref:Uncharacterized protein n=1 Tax=Trametes cubensis TaxID=1111947 RepID=A0AAD7TDZ0_9APHY|nr:hypothetical protein ONZ51_g13581 [Trametes cubensis]